MSTQKTAVMAITAAVCWGLRLSWGEIPLGGDGCSTGCSTLFVGETDRLVIKGYIAHGAVEVAVLAMGGVVIIARPEKKMGIGKQKVSPVANTAKNHTLPASNNPTSPATATSRCGAETAESAAMCAKDVSLPTRAKTSLPHCGEVSFPDLKFPPAALAALHFPCL